VNISDKFADALIAGTLLCQYQRDKAGIPYALHVVRVACSLLPDEDAAIVGAMHDILEDCSNDTKRAQMKEAILLFQKPFISEAVLLLARDKSVLYADYIAALAPNPLARKVKLADLRDNLRPDRIAAAEANGHDMSQLKQRYQAALTYLEAYDGQRTND
jgi:hypothetical protein